jgi:hypothetical protein
MKFTARELVTLEEALSAMTPSPTVDKLLIRVQREKPRKTIGMLSNGIKL